MDERKGERSRDCGTVWWVPVLFLITLILFCIGISEITFGVRHKADCPRERLLFVYLIVQGVFTLSLCVLQLVCVSQFFTSGVNGSVRSDVKLKRMCILSALLVPFLIGWFLAGNVLVYRIYGDFSKSSDSGSSYCNHKLYNFAFCSIIIRWIALLVYSLVASVVCCSASRNNSQARQVVSIDLDVI